MVIKLRDSVTIIDEEGEETEFFIEALFDVDDESFALIRKEDNSMFLTKIEEDQGEQYLVPVSDPNKSSNILDAYQIAVEKNPAE
jgi:uncharacterized protein YrzB (UPF0473 family)